MSDEHEVIEYDEPNLPPNAAFSTTIPTLQIAYDQTSIGEAKLCWQRYKYSIIDGYEPNDTNIHFFFGAEYQHSRELYAHLKAEGFKHKEAAEEVTSDLLQRTWDKRLRRPWASDNSYKNRGTLLRTVLWYLAEFELDPLETLILDNSKPAVELHFDISLGYKSRLTDEEFRLTGHLDEIVLFENRPAISDNKTTKFQITSSYFARFNPDNQVSAYLVGGNSILTHYGPSEPLLTMIINAAQIKVNSTTFKRGIIGRTPAQLDQWIKDLFVLFEEFERRAENNYWPMNDKACGLPHTDPKTGEVRYSCPFREVCSADPSMRELLLKANFSKRVWDPSKSRELVRGAA